MFHHRYTHYRLATLVHSRGSRLYRHLVWGGGLIALGLVVWLKGQGLITPHEMWLAAPGLLAWSGLVRLAIDRNAAAAARAAVRIVLAAGLVLAIEQVGTWSTAALWPLLLIAFGVATIVHALVHRSSPCGDASEDPTW